MTQPVCASVYHRIFNIIIVKGICLPALVYEYIKISVEPLFFSLSRIFSVIKTTMNEKDRVYFLAHPVGVTCFHTEGACKVVALIKIVVFHFFRHDDYVFTTACLFLGLPLTELR